MFLCSVHNHNLITFQTLVESSTKEQLQDIVLQLLDKYPAVAFDVLEDAPAPSGQGYHPPSPGGDLPWCTCGRCREMPKEIEKLCCGKQVCITRYPVRLFQNLKWLKILTAYVFRIKLITNDECIGHHFLKVSLTLAQKFPHTGPDTQTQTHRDTQSDRQTSRYFWNWTISIHSVNEMTVCKKNSPIYIFSFYAT